MAQAADKARYEMRMLFGAFMDFDSCAAAARACSLGGLITPFRSESDRIAIAV
jgi:hypothetical protein